MKRTSLSILAVMALAVGASGAWAQKAKIDAGQREFLNSCAVCHGKDATGTGTGILDLLKTAPADLTTLSRKNNGVFPFERVYAVIDGREIVKGHGDRDMPVWGDRFKADTIEAAEYYVDVPYNMEMYARARTLAVIDYLNRIQIK